MMVALQLAAALAAAVTPLPSLADIAHAIDAGRLEQARLMIGNAAAAGVHGPRLDRLMADLDYASGSYAEASARYQQLLLTDGHDEGLMERGGIAAFKSGDLSAAARLIDSATAAPNASWRSWNARGVLADMKSDWAAADDAFARALAIAPNRAEVLNNRGWSMLMRGSWSDAERDFEQAVSADPGLARAANNLELARSALSSDLPQRRPRETDEGWAARLNDTGVASSMLGDRTRAVAAFTQALEASGTWYRRAANNLNSVRGGK